MSTPTPFRTLTERERELLAPEIAAYQRADAERQRALANLYRVLELMEPSIADPAVTFHGDTGTFTRAAASDDPPSPPSSTTPDPLT